LPSKYYYVCERKKDRKKEREREIERERGEREEREG